jgi:eukaryotic-like serine/threonine-protein kinase
MPLKEFHYRWEFDLQSSPEQLWPLISDTNRFNRDTGVPSVEAIGEGRGNIRRRLRLTTFGIPIEWEEEPFEWVRPERFAVVRRYSKGPVAELRVLATLSPRNDSAGTKLVYEVWAKPNDVLGLLAIPVQVGVISKRPRTGNTAA